MFILQEVSREWDESLIALLQKRPQKQDTRRNRLAYRATPVDRLIFAHVKISFFFTVYYRCYTLAWDLANRSGHGRNSAANQSANPRGHRQVKG